VALTVARGALAQDAAAQDAPQASQEATADDPAIAAYRERFKMGLERYKAGDVAQAIQYWEPLYRDLGQQKGYRVAYDLARAHEELADTSKAIAEFCRYLTLSPGGREATDVRNRLSRIVPRAESKRSDDVQVAFRLGLALFDDGRFDASTRAFTEVIRNAPAAAEAIYNRGLARAAAGQRADALTDLEQFRAAAPTVDDRVQVARAIERLRRPVYSAGAAFGRGLLPGFGQFYTGRPVRGVLALLLATGSAGAAFVQKTSTTRVAYTDPNGVSAPYTLSTTERPYFAAAIGAAVGITVIAAIEAAVFANGTQSGASIIAPRGSSAPPATGFAVAPTLDRFGHAGVRLSVPF